MDLPKTTAVIFAKSVRSKKIKQRVESWVSRSRTSKRVAWGGQKDE